MVVVNQWVCLLLGTFSKMQSLEFATLEPYLNNGELKNHTVGILRREEEAKVAEIEEEDERYRLDMRRGLELRLVKKFDK